MQFGLPLQASEQPEVAGHEAAQWQGPPTEEWMRIGMQQMPRLDLTPEELHKKYTEGLESGSQELIAISVNLVAL